MPRHHIRREVTGKVSDTLIARPNNKLKVSGDGRVHKAEPAAPAPATPAVEVEIDLGDINEDKTEEVIAVAPVEDTTPAEEPKKNKRRSRKKKGD